jgi:hypothetical protein
MQVTSNRKTINGFTVNDKRLSFTVYRLSSIRRLLFIVYCSLFTVNAQVTADSAVVMQNPVAYYKAKVQEKEREKLLRQMIPLNFRINEYRLEGIRYPEIRWEPPPPPPPFGVSSFQAWQDDARYNYLYIFKEAHWKPVVPDFFTALDSLPAQVIRAKLQAKFGNPATDAVSRFEKWGWKHDEAIEFTYFLTVNDSIPLMLSDINGPFEEGLVILGNDRDSTYFPLIKKALTDTLVATKGVAYKSVYRKMEAEKEQWLDVSYDGETYRVLPRTSPFVQPSTRRENGRNNRN